jgi:hypothetical protein
MTLMRYSRGTHMPLTEAEYVPVRKGGRTVIATLGIVAFLKSLVALGAIGTHLQRAEGGSTEERVAHLRSASWWGGAEGLSFLVMCLIFGL